MIAAENLIPKKKLVTIKFPSQRVDAVPGTRSCEFRQKSTVPGANKRGPSGVIECPLEKRQKMDHCVIKSACETRQKMDRSMTHQCSILLKELMGHPAGWVFNKPVDPVALNIPDYFSIILNPMDLGTIKSKLQKNLYVAIDEFAADVRLTFSNATLYNPPTNNVHKMALELEKLFESRWMSLEEKWKCERSKFGNGKNLSGRTIEISDAKQNCPKTPPLRSATLPKRSKPSEEMVERNSFNAKAIEMRVSKPTGNCVRKLVEKNCEKGTDGGVRYACGSSINVKPSLSPIASKCGTCGRNACECSISSDSTRATSDISSERSSGRDNRECSADKACQAKSMSGSRVSMSDPDSDGAVSSVDDDTTCPSSELTTATNSAPREGLGPPFDVQLSPTKALRAAILKQRFADTILKAQHKTLLDHGDKADPLKMQQEKERLERRQREEKARIEARIRAAEAASRKREEIELKRQRAREREAARVALQKMEKTAEIEQNVEILKELEKLSGCSVTINFHFYRKGAKACKGEFEVAHFGGPLERLGLFIKDDFCEEDEEMILDGEEGEILS